MAAHGYPGFGLEPYMAFHPISQQDSLEQQVQPYVPLTDRYAYIRRVGHSSEGLTALARPINGGQLRVLKIIKHPHAIHPPREAGMLDAVKTHRNIVKTFEVEYNLTSKNAVISLEYATRGDLFDQIYHFHLLRIYAPTAIVLHAMAQIGEALAFMHGGWVRCHWDSDYHVAASTIASIVHRDIKPSNILIRFPGHENGLPDFVLADFGQSFQPAHEPVFGGGGTPGYRAPELEDNTLLEPLTPPTPLTPKADVYAYGVTMLNLCHGHHADLFGYGQNPDRIELPQHLRNFGITRLLKACLVAKPELRIDIAPAGALPFVLEFRKYCRA